MRMICSRVNEETFLDDLPGNKSLAVGLNMTSDDTRITPCVDLDQVALVLTSNRVNAPVSNYATDFRVNKTATDPNRFFYVTKNISLENPASSLQVILDGYIPEDADVRCFYSLDQEGPVDNSIFVPFPGFGNFQSNGAIASRGVSNGKPDLDVPKVDVFTPKPNLGLYKEYKFSVDELPSFKSFRIKLIGTSRNQATVPMIRNFRVISLA